MFEKGLFTILILLLIGCGERVPAVRTPRPISTISDLFQVQPTRTARPTLTPRPTFQVVAAVTATLTPTVTVSETINIATTVAPTETPAAPTFVIYDEELHADWSLEGSTVNYDLRYRGEAFRGAYALEVERDLDNENDNAFLPTLEMNLLPEAAQGFPLATIESVSLWIYSGNGTLGVRDVSLGVVLSTEPFPSDNAILNVIELELTMFGLEETVEPDTWVQLRYSPQELVTDEAFAYLTGIYIENNVGFTQAILVDGVEIRFLTDDEVWQSAELIAITP